MSDAVRYLAEDYSATAAAYDTLWGPVILPMALPVLDELRLSSAARILDVGAGTGGMLPHLRSRAPSARIYAVDRAEGMLRLARRRAIADCAVMDAERLAIGTERIDAAVLAFVLFHFPDPAAALLDLRRVMRGDGRIGTVTWAVDPGIPCYDVWNEELDARGAAPDPRGPSVRQHALVDTAEKITALLEAAGFRVKRTWTATFERGWTHESLLEMQQICGAAGRRLSTLPPGARAECVAAVRARVSAIPVEKLVWTPEVLFAVGDRR